MTQRPDEEIIAVMRCSLCRRLIQTVDPLEGGAVEIKGVPTSCANPACQAGFGRDTDHAIEMVMYRRM